MKFFLKIIFLEKKIIYKQRIKENKPINIPNTFLIIRNLPFVSRLPTTWVIAFEIEKKNKFSGQRNLSLEVIIYLFSLLYDLRNSNQIDAMDISYMLSVNTKSRFTLQSFLNLNAAYLPRESKIYSDINEKRKWDFFF